VSSNLGISDVFKYDNSTEDEDFKDFKNPPFDNWKDWIHKFSRIEPWSLWNLVEMENDVPTSVAPYFCQM